MKFFIFIQISCLLLNIALLTGQTSKIDYNLDFEIINPKNSLPVWIWPGGGNYECKIDSVIKQHGKYSISIESLKDTSSTGHYGNFGVFTSFIPSQFVGSEIILRGWLKTENVSNWAGLWLRIDGANGPIAFDNMYSRKINGTNEWNEYSIKLPFSDNAKQIVFGGLMNNTGKIWVDNIEILIDSVDISKAKVKTYKADLDSEFIKSSRINNIKTDKKTIEDLSVLGKVWGFLKYYHPEIAKGNFNLDFELFRILPMILKCRDKNERSKIILDWINKYGNIEPCEKCTELDTTNTKIVPDFGWIEDSSYFNKDLIQKLNFIKNNRNQDKHYYFDFVPSVCNVEFQNENAYKDMN
ncbi:MAG: peptidase S41, partial [Ignavibacteriae bacterium]|nr:peptidase S41 [Ignavibacteriota bacterium]